MPNFITLNQFADTITEATIVRWLVRVGDRIDIGDALVEVENEIASMEITSPHKGIIGALYASEGMKVPVGDSLAVILDEGEDLPEPPSINNEHRSNDSSTKVRVNNGLETGTAKFNSTGIPRVFYFIYFLIIIGIVAFLSYVTNEEEKEKKAEIAAKIRKDAATKKGKEKLLRLMESLYYENSADTGKADVEAIDPVSSENTEALERAVPLPAVDSYLLVNTVNPTKGYDTFMVGYKDPTSISLKNDDIDNDTDPAEYGTPQVFGRYGDDNYMGKYHFEMSALDVNVSDVPAGGYFRVIVTKFGYGNGLDIAYEQEQGVRPSATFLDGLRLNIGVVAVGQNATQLDVDPAGLPHRIALAANQILDYTIVDIKLNSDKTAVSEIQINGTITSSDPVEIDTGGSESEEAPNLKYKIKGNEVTITYCDKKTSGVLTIPASIEGKPVTSIGDFAFRGCRSLKSITIPDGVTSIKTGAFSGCTSLTSITIPDSVISIGDRAFKWCNSMQTITISDSVTSIGKEAFNLCKSLTSITIPDSVTSIGGGAFFVCSSITSITIADSVTSIGNYAFGRCGKLTSVTFLGDAPKEGKEIFSRSTPTIYRKPEAKGWGDTFAGQPVKLISEKP